MKEEAPFFNQTTFFTEREIPQIGMAKHDEAEKILPRFWQAKANIS